MPRLSVLMIRTALIYLAVGFFIGGLMLFNKAVLLDGAIFRLPPIHVDLLMFGWTMQLIMGTAFWILPRFEKPPKYGRVVLVRAAFVLLNAGVMTAVIGQWINQAGIILIGRVILLVAVLCFVVHIAPRVRPFLQTS